MHHGDTPLTALCAPLSYPSVQCSACPDAVATPRHLRDGGSRRHGIRRAPAGEHFSNETHAFESRDRRRRRCDRRGNGGIPAALSPLSLSIPRGRDLLSRFGSPPLGWIARSGAYRLHHCSNVRHPKRRTLTARRGPRSRGGHPAFVCVESFRISKKTRGIRSIRGVHPVHRDLPRATQSE